MARSIGILLSAALALGAALMGPSASARSGCSVRGGSGSDVLTGTMATDRICARAGDDTALGLDARDVVRSGSGNDNVQGGGGNDRIKGDPGSDTLSGNQGVDVIRGGPGDDYITTSDGVEHDRALGGAGNDTCIVDSTDTVRGCETVTVRP
jgi:Ca2+-binding RTX toxin-like protein